MTVGDWSDTTDFWTNPPPLIYSALSMNTMFLNTFRLYKGMERFHESQFQDYYTYTWAGMGGYWYYAFRITNDCPWDRLTIVEKIQTTSALGTANLVLTVQHMGAEVMRNVTLDCQDYAAFTWLKVIDNYDITGWAAGNHIVRVFWWPQSTAGCTGVNVKCRHAMLEASLS